MRNLPIKSDLKVIPHKRDKTSRTKTLFIGKLPCLGCSFYFYNEIIHQS